MQTAATAEGVHQLIDRRYMAARDLSGLVSLNGSLFSGRLQPEIVAAYMKQLQDPVVEVQGNAVVGLSRLVEDMHEESLYALRDMYAACLRNVLSAPISSPTVHASMINRILPKLTKILKDVSPNSERLVIASIDLLSVMISNTSGIVTSWLGPYPSSFERSLLTIISSDPFSSRRCASLLGQLAGVRTDDDLKKSLEAVVGMQSHSVLVIFVHAIVNQDKINRTKPYLGSLILPALLSFISSELMKFDACDADLVVMGYSILGSALELKSCRNVSGWFLETDQVTSIEKLSKQGVEFNPNYIEDAGSEDYDDDEDDSSWKIRKASGGVIKVLVGRRPVDIELIEFIISRLKSENESVVRCQILSALEGVLLSQPQLNSLQSINKILRNIRAKNILDRIGSWNNHRRESETNGSRDIHPVDIHIVQEYLDILRTPVHVVDDVKPRLHAVHAISESITTTLPDHRLTAQSLICIDSILSLLVLHVLVVADVVSEVDLGPFKHRVDAAAGLRRAVVVLADIIGKLIVNQSDIARKSSFAQKILCLVQAIFSVDLSNSGDELYPYARSMIGYIQTMDCGLLFDAVPELCQAMLTIVEKAPVGKKGGDETAPNTIGTTLGQLFERLIKIIKSIAYEEGFTVEAVFTRPEYTPIRNALLRIRKEQTEGSILMGAKLFLDKVVVE